MLAADGALFQPVSARRRRSASGRNDRGGRGRRRAGRLGRRSARNRRARRRRSWASRPASSSSTAATAATSRERARLPDAQAGPLAAAPGGRRGARRRAGVPHLPRRQAGRSPAGRSAPCSGWPAQALSLLLTRLRPGAGNLAASGVVGISMMFRAVAVGVVLIAVAAGDPEIGGRGRAGLRTRVHARAGAVAAGLLRKRAGRVKRALALVTTLALLAPQVALAQEERRSSTPATSSSSTPGSRSTSARSTSRSPRPSPT